MVKAKKGFNLFPLIVAHPWLKLISLVLAILVWFYVSGEIGKDY